MAFRAKIKKSKDPFEALDSDFKDAVAGEAPDQIRQRIAKVALDELANQKSKEDDQDLAEKKEAYRMAGEGYKEASKMNKLRIKFCRRVLVDKGAMTEED